MEGVFGKEECLIGFLSDTPITHSDKKWDKILVGELSNVADQWIIQEEEHLAKEESEEAEEPKTINEQNEEASKELERLANSDVIQLNKNPKKTDEKKVEYPY